MPIPQSTIDAIRDRIFEAFYRVGSEATRTTQGTGLGLHLVRVVDVVEGRVPDLSEVRDEVLRDYGSEVRSRANEALYDNLRAQYEIEIDDETIRKMSMQRRGEGGGS